MKLNFWQWIGLVLLVVGVALLVWRETAGKKATVESATPPTGPAVMGFPS